MVPPQRFYPSSCGFHPSEGSTAQLFNYGVRGARGRETAGRPPDRCLPAGARGPGEAAAPCRPPPPSPSRQLPPPQPPPPPPHEEPPPQDEPPPQEEPPPHEEECPPPQE
ncbi:hypothetical protein TNCT1_15930 [Streptomyces sp. 1-11]|nr:hypothetical protein TNCT1_15930 [Streptomyces sp. 1-11]